MKIPINLASQPYENLRPWYLAVAASAVVLAVLAGLVGWNLRQNANRTRELTQQNERFVKDTAALKRQQQELTQWLNRPDVQEIRDRSAFLNSLILRKSLSWTQMFMDLEKVLPDRVQVNAVRPSENESSQAALNLSVSATTAPPLIEFLKNLESSPQFGAPVVEAQRYPTEKSSDQSIVLEMSVIYHQNAPAAKSSAEPAADENGNGAAAQGKVRRADGGGAVARESGARVAEARNESISAKGK